MSRYNTTAVEKPRWELRKAESTSQSTTPSFFLFFFSFFFRVGALAAWLCPKKLNSNKKWPYPTLTPPPPLTDPFQPQKDRPVMLHFHRSQPLRRLRLRDGPAQTPPAGIQRRIRVQAVGEPGHDPGAATRFRYPSYQRSTEGTWKIHLLLKEPSVRCYDSGREGGWFPFEKS